MPKPTEDNAYQKLVKMICARRARCLWQVTGPKMHRTPPKEGQAASRLEGWVIAGRPGILIVHEFPDGDGFDLYSSDLPTSDFAEIEALLGPTEDDLRRDAQERADHQIHITVGESDDSMSLAEYRHSSEHNAHAAHHADVVPRIRQLALGDSLVVGDDTIVRVNPPDNGEEVTCATEFTSDGARFMVDLRGGIGHVFQHLPARISGWHEIGAFTWQGEVSDTMDGIDEALSDPQWEALDAAVRAAWSQAQR